MNLDFNYSAVADQSNCRDDAGNITGLCQTMILTCMQIGMGSITEKNATAFWERAALFERACGTMRETKKGPLFMTQEEVTAFVGLRTNVPGKSDRKFRADLGRFLLERVEREHNRAVADAAKAAKAQNTASTT